MTDKTIEEIEAKARRVGECRVAGDGLHDPGLTPGSPTGVDCTRCGDHLPADHPFPDAIREARRAHPPLPQLTVQELLSSLAKSIASCDHLGDVHEVMDRALRLAGLPMMPTTAEGIMSTRGWITGVPSLYDLAKKTGQ